MDEAAGWPAASGPRPSSLGLVTTSLPTVARVVSILCWVAVAAVLVRIVSGGGSLTGVGYVLATEPRVALATGAIVLSTAVFVSVALLQRRPWAWRASAAGAGAALAGSLILVVDDHSSALVAAAAAALALTIGLHMMSGPGDPD